MIVIGTGLEESIVAAAVARNGHSVLHIDTKDYYGEDWASFNFRALQDWITSQSSEAAQNQTAESTESKKKLNSLKNASFRAFYINNRLIRGHIQPTIFKFLMQ